MNAAAWDGNAAGLILSVVSKQTIGFALAFLAIGISQIAVVRRVELNTLRAVGAAGHQIVLMLAIASVNRTMRASVVGLPLAWVAQEVLVDPSTLGFNGSIRLDEFCAAITIVLASAMCATVVGFLVATRRTVAEGLR